MNSVHQLPALFGYRQSAGHTPGKAAFEHHGFISASRCLRDFGNIHSDFGLLSVLEKAAFVLSMARLWAKIPMEYVER